MCVCAPILVRPSHAFVSQREPQLRCQWVGSYAFPRRSWHAPRTLSCPIGSPNYAASGWVRMRFRLHLAHPSHAFVPHRELQLRRQRVISHAVPRPVWRTPHTLSCPIGSPNYAASGWVRMQFRAQSGAPLTCFRAPIGSPNYAASGWDRMQFRAQSGAPLTRFAPHREHQLRRQWVVSYVVPRPVWRWDISPNSACTYGVLN